MITRIFYVLFKNEREEMKSLLSHSIYDKLWGLNKYFQEVYIKIQILELILIFIQGNTLFQVRRHKVDRYFKS